MRRALLAWWFLGLVACSGPPPAFHRQLYVFGTLVDVQAYGTDEARFSQALAALQQRFQAMHRDWHAWKGDGKLIRLNQAFAEGRCAPHDPELEAIIRRARQLEDQSGGRFNPAIGRLITLWGFHTDDFPIEGPPPDDRAIQALLARRPSLRDIHIDERGICSENSAVMLDLGGFAKGLAVDEALMILARHGIHHAIVNAGGDLRVAGRHGERNWQVAVRDPSRGDVLLRIAARDGEAIFTSGNYYRYRAHAGKRYAHILDPRTGYPVQAVQSATVIAPDGALADAAATALVVAGVKEAMQTARDMGLDQILLVDASGTVWLTPAMKKRVQYIRTPAVERWLVPEQPTRAAH